MKTIFLNSKGFAHIHLDSMMVHDRDYKERENYISVRFGNRQYFIPPDEIDFVEDEDGSDNKNFDAEDPER
ncbi:MAG: hypothetical protein AAF492_10370 [Verrucomicrobiota bacterium]